MMQCILTGIADSVLEVTPSKFSGFSKKQVEDNGSIEDNVSDYTSRDEYQGFYSKKKSILIFISSQYTFVDYAGRIFSKLRKMQKIDNFLQSFGLVQLEDKMKEKFSEGRSGSFFWVTEDNKYMIKTMTRGESIFLRRIVPQYFHVC
jgi:hypothetical protein